jgi:hypothetical protein
MLYVDQRYHPVQRDCCSSSQLLRVADQLYKLAAVYTDQRYRPVQMFWCRASIPLLRVADPIIQVRMCY